MENSDKSGLTEFTKYPFYNTSGFTLKKLLDEPRSIKENLIDYLNGFSDNVQEIINKFKAQNAKCMALSTHCQRSGVSLTEQDGYNIIIRTTTSTHSS